MLINKKLGEILVDAGEITQDQLDFALQEQKKGSKRLGEVLIDLGFITETNLLRTLEKQFNVPYITFGNHDIMKDAIDKVPIFLAERYTLLPLRKEGNKLTVVMNDPTNFYAIDDVRMITGCEIQIVLGERQEIINGINNSYGVSGRIGDAIGKLEDNTTEGRVLATVVEGQDDAPIIKIVNSIIEQAIRDRASDIHIEAQAGETRARFRIDGVLRNVASFPSSSHNAIISRIKIMANMDIAERRVPQDGRIDIKDSGRNIDLRISTLPTILGEKVVMRILDKGTTLIHLDKLGFSENNLKMFRDVYSYSHGIVLVTGPTGSGKSTTLYATLSELNNSTKNIITVEEPVEYTMVGINQVNVNNKAGLTFASGLRSILRQDPNIIMVGEIRDEETARISINAALTGHLVLSTLHTNDAAGAITRLVDMGIEPFLVVSSLKGIVAQRLARCICPECKEEYVPDAISTERQYMGIGPEDPIKLYRGKGCKSCEFTGYSGRLAIHEVLTVVPEMKELILNGASDIEIFRAGEKVGAVSMKKDGIQKALEGKTTIEELMRVAYS